MNWIILPALAISLTWADRAQARTCFKTWHFNTPPNPHPLFYFLGKYIERFPWTENCSTQNLGITRQSYRAYSITLICHPNILSLKKKARNFQMLLDLLNKMFILKAVILYEIKVSLGLLKIFTMLMRDIS